MDLEALRAVCATLPGTVEDVKWGGDLCLCVGGKMYAVTGLEGGGLSIKVPPEEFEALCARPGIEPAPYLARYQWVKLDESYEASDPAVAEWIRTSYALVRAKLPKKVRDALP